MEPFGQAILDQLRLRRVRWVELCTEIVNGSLAPEVREHFGVDAESAGQVVDGFAAVLSEGLEGKATETYDQYVGAVIPALVQFGAPLEMLLSVAVSWALLVMGEIQEELPSEQRAPARRWLAGFYGRYVADVYHAGMRAMQTSADRGGA